MLTIFLGLLAIVAADKLLAARRELNLAKTQLVAAKTALSGKDDAATKSALDAADAKLRSAKRKGQTFPLNVLAPVPLIGSPGRAITSASDAGRDAVAAGRVLAAAAASFPTHGAAGIDGHDLSAFNGAAIRSTGALTDAEQKLDSARHRLNGPAGAMLPPVSGAARSMIKVVDQARKQLDGARRGLSLLGDLTAPTTDAKILLLSQDTMELRATGGFIGSFGIVHFNHGTVKLERYDSLDALPPPDPPMTPPQALRRSLPSWWGISNVNWWPDFPTTAATAREMFRRQGGGTVDGVVAITNDTMASLVGVVGPVQVPGYAQPISEPEFADRVLYEVELKQPKDNPPKKFLTNLSHEVFDRVFQLSGSQVPGLATSLGKSVGIGGLQTWFVDRSRQAAVAGTALSGALPETSGDFLMLVDSNLTSSKANRELTRDVTYEMKRDDRGRLVGKVEVIYRNSGAASTINPYYNGYLRIYVPGGARLIGVQSGVRDEGMASDGPYRVFGLDAFVLPGSTKSYVVNYELPSSVAPGSAYHLQWRRQPGTSSDVLTAHIRGRTYTLAPRNADLVVNVTVRRGLRDFLRTRWLGRFLA
ncbi:MAG: hypothetical protein JWO37_33 [Acidimicrobiales bacterium]|nr:hypothetical protein [Acidimicrobiales bacterium]